MKTTFHMGATALAVLIAFADLAGATSDSLTRARQAYQEFEYDRVLPLLEKALREDPTDQERVEAYEMMANMHVMHGRRRQAQKAFAEVLQIDPNYELPTESSPKMHTAFEAAQAEHIPLDDPNPPPPEETLEPIDLHATDSPRGDGDGDDTEQQLTDPAHQLVRKLVPDRTPFYQTWWFWTAVGVVAVGAVGATWFATHLPAPEHDLGPIPMGGP